MDAIHTGLKQGAKSNTSSQGVEGKGLQTISDEHSDLEAIWKLQEESTT